MRARQLRRAAQWLVAVVFFGVSALFLLYGLAMWATDDAADCSHEDQYDCNMIHQGRVVGPVVGAVGIGLGCLVLWSPNIRDLWELPEEQRTDNE